MKQAWEKWNSWSLIGRIACGLVIGILLALVIPGLDGIVLLGTLFVAALKAVAPILVFFLIISALCNARQSGAMKRIILLYLLSTFLAGVVAVLACNLVPLHLTLADAVDKAAPSGIGEVMTNLLTSVVANPVDALANANFLGILTWAILIGVALRAASETTKEVMGNIADAVQTVVRVVIAFAPFGVLGLVYNAVSTSGLGIFTEYGMLLLVLVGCMLIMAFVVNPAIVYAQIHRNPYPLVMRCLKDSAITAFFTRSSAANIPINLELCKKLGLNKDNYSVSIPLGATINMGGATVTISVMAMAAAQTLGIQVDFITGVILCVLAAVSACGASGVAGGSLLLIPVACSLLGIPNDIAMQVVGIGFIIGVIQDSCETALNSSSDALFTATAEYVRWNKVGKDYVPGHDNTPLVEA
ncbi:MAG: serine/threonine transporter SstT [Eggerthellaceae bacterium]|jgi:serine/threonine transporter|nr:serine/threonine transporter SstT [Eggerthellaceae bacterium]